MGVTTEIDKPIKQKLRKKTTGCRNSSVSYIVNLSQKTIVSLPRILFLNACKIFFNFDTIYKIIGNHCNIKHCDLLPIIAQK